MTAQAERCFESGGTRLCYFEWGDPEGQPILLLHATGFHARCWDATIEHLPQDHRIIAVDHLGHGRSSKPDSLADWAKTAEPLGALVEELGLRNIVGAGHSMGGHCLVQLAAKMGERFERLTLIDPVIMAPDMYERAPMAEDIDPAGHPVSKRRNLWESPKALHERLKDHPSYVIWRPGVLMDYCEHGLLALEEGGYELACPGHLEASVYLGSLCLNPHPLIPRVGNPVTILRAPRIEKGDRMDFRKSPTWPGLADTFPNAVEHYFPELTHFMPMEDPALIASFIAGDEVAGSAAK